MLGKLSLPCESLREMSILKHKGSFLPQQTHCSQKLWREEKVLSTCAFPPCYLCPFGFLLNIHFTDSIVSVQTQSMRKVCITSLKLQSSRMLTQGGEEARRCHMVQRSSYSFLLKSKPRAFSLILDLPFFPTFKHSRISPSALAPPHSCFPI